jgi:hypothetical protein
VRVTVEAAGVRPPALSYLASLPAFAIDPALVAAVSASLAPLSVIGTVRPAKVAAV